MSLEPLRGVDVDALEAAAQADTRDAERRDAMPTDVLDAILKGVGRHALLRGYAEERRLAMRIERGDLAAKERMVKANLGLVVSVAKTYRGRGLEFADLVQERNVRARPRRREVRLPPRLQLSQPTRCRGSTRRRGRTGIQTNQGKDS